MSALDIYMSLVNDLTKLSQAELDKYEDKLMSFRLTLEDALADVEDAIMDVHNEQGNRNA